MDIRLLTRLIVRRDGEYLNGEAGLLGTQWRNSPYDAWWTRDRMEAFRVAWKYRGTVMLFNPAVGRVKELPLRMERAQQGGRNI